MEMIITILHMLLLLFTITIPFTNSNYFILLYIIFVPFLFAHWICKDNSCVVTIIESKLRKRLGLDNNCISCKLINPVYDIIKNYNKYSPYIYTFMISLWSLCLWKIYNKYQNGDISKYLDLFKI